MMNLRPRTQADDKLINDLCQLSYKNETQWIGYPRVANINELKAEIAEYSNTLDECILMIEDGSKTIGFTGYLHETGDQDAYIIGPVFNGDCHTVENVSEVLSMLKAKSNFSTLYITTPSNNQVTNTALQQQKWKQTSDQLEMVFNISSARELESQVLVTKIEEKQIPEVADLFREAFQWDDAETELRHYLNQFGMKAACIYDDVELKGAVLWDEVDGTTFVRLEDVAVKPKYRRQGIATQLIKHVLRESFEQSKADIFLAVDLDHTDAIKLYEKLGFERNMVNYSYEP